MAHLKNLWEEIAERAWMGRWEGRGPDGKSRTVLVLDNFLSLGSYI